MSYVIKSTNAIGLTVGNGLGISSSAFSQVGSLNNYQSFGQAKLNCVANLVNGNLFIEDKKFSFPDIGSNIDFSYVYNSLGGWKFAYARQVKNISGQLSVIEADGKEVKYSLESDGFYYADENNNSRLRLKKLSSGYEIYNPATHATEVFKDDGLIVSSTDDAGNITNYEYKKGELSAIIAPSGVRYFFKHGKNKIDIYLDFNESTIPLHTYIFENGKLQTSRTSDGYEINYKYKNDVLDCVTQSDSSTLKFNFTKNKLTKVQVGSDLSNCWSFNYLEGKTEVLNPANEVSKVEYDPNLHIISFESSTCQKKLIFSKERQLKSISTNNLREAFYHNLKTGLITEHKKPDGSRTQFVYSDDDQCLFLRKIDYDLENRPHTTSYFYETINEKYSALKFTVSPKGRVTAFVNDKHGLVKELRKYIKDFYPSTSELSLKAIQSWTSKLPPVNVAVTENEYDSRGRKNLIKTLIDANSEDYAQDYFVQDNYGNIVQHDKKVTDTKNFITEYQYDDIARIKRNFIGKNSPLKQKEAFTYQNNKVTHTYPNGLQEQKVLNTAGHVISEKNLAENKSLETIHQYFPKYNARITTDADGHKTIAFFNIDHELTAEVSAGGKVILYERQQSPNYVIKSQYDQSIDVQEIERLLKNQQSYSEWALSFIKNSIHPLAKIKNDLIQSKSELRQTQIFSDFNGRPRFEIDEDGYLVEHRYNYSGKPIHHILYQDKITVDELAILKNGQDVKRTPDRNHDLIDSNFYDDDDYLIAEQDAAGYVIEYIRDAGGRENEIITHHQPVLNFSNQFETISPGLHKKDIHEYVFHNLKDEPILNIDGDSYPTENNYFYDGKIKSIRRYVTKVSSEFYASTDKIPRLIKSDQDEEITFEYDDLRRNVTLRYSNGLTETFEYDDMDNELTHKRYDSQNPDQISGDYLRGNAKQVDSFGNVIANINAFVFKILAQEKIINKSFVKQYADKYSHTKIGLKLFSIDPLGNKTTFYYDADKNPILSINADGVIVENILNGYAEVDESYRYYNPLPKEELKSLTGGYITSELLARIHGLRNPEKDSVDKVTKRNQRGLALEKEDAEGNQYHYQYDAFKRCTLEALPVADQTPTLQIVKEFEQRGLPTKITKKSADKEISIESKYENPLGKETYHRDELGVEKEFEHDKRGNKTETKIKLEDGDWHTLERIQYNAFSNPTEITNADKEKTILEYNQKERTVTSYPENAPNYKTILEQNIFSETNKITKKDGDKVLTEEIISHASDGQIETQQDGVGNQSKNIFNLVGNEIAQVNTYGIVTDYTHNASGNILTSITDEKNHNIKNVFSPNALGQYENVIDANGNTTNNIFNKNGSLIEKIFPATTGRIKPTINYDLNAQGDIVDLYKGDEKDFDQYHERYERDGFNYLIAKIVDPVGIHLKTSYENDAAGNVTAEIDPMGFAKRRYFNFLQQERFRVNDLNNETAAVIESTYTLGGKIKCFREYVKPLDRNFFTSKTKISDIESQVLRSNQDKITWFFPDDLGRNQFTLKLIYSKNHQRYEAIVEEKEFDGANREIKTIIYKDRLIFGDDTQPNFKDLKQRVEKELSKDRALITYHWYDKSSAECLTVLPNGLTVENVYKSGHQIKKIEHFNQLLNPENFINQQLTDVLKNIQPDERDKKTHYVRDNLGRIIFRIEPNGKVKKQLFDKKNNVVNLCTFKTPYFPPENYEQMVQELNQLVPVAGVDTITKKSYDGQDNLADIIYTVKNAKKEVSEVSEKFIRDSLANTTIFVDRDNQIWLYVYDRALRKIKETSPITTMTQVEKDENGKLIPTKLMTNVIKENEFDKNNNTTKITSGIVNEGDQARVFNAYYQAEQKLVGTTVTALVDDGSAHDVQDKNLVKLPQKEIIIETKIIRDARGKKLAKLNENGKWNFYIRDNLGRKLFEIQDEQVLIQYKYHRVFDKIIKVRRYALPVKVDVTRFKNGITLDDIGFDLETTNKIIIKKSPNDRIDEFQYNDAGLVESVKSAPVYYFSNGIYGKAQPETKYAYDIFNNPLIEAKLIRPGVWAKKFTWPDKHGQPLAEINERNYVVLFQRDAAGNELERIEYAISLEKSVDDIQSLEELKLLIKPSPKDRKYKCEFDTLNHKIKERVFVRDGITDNFIDPEIQVIQFNEVNGKKIPSINNVRMAVVKEWGYTDTEKPLFTKLEDGSFEYKFYEPRGILIGESKVTRTSQDEQGKEIKLTPLVINKVNAFGQNVADNVIVYTTNEVTSEFNTEFYNQLKNEIIKADGEYDNILLHDNRGLPHHSENRLGQRKVFLHTPTKQIARELLTANTYQPSPQGPKQVFHVDEKRYGYDDLDTLNFSSISRDGEVEEATHRTNNAFKEMIAEGSSVDDNPLYIKRDARGYIWNSNVSGVNSINLSDLRGGEALQLHAAQDNLQNVAYEDLSSFITRDDASIERTETIRDVGGLPEDIKFPRWFKDKKTRPSRQFKHDHWENQIEEVDSLGNVWNKDFNFRNALITQTDPLIPYITENNSLAEGRPSTHFGWNITGYDIGKVDANNHADVYLLDEAGQWLSHVKGDGSIPEKRILNGYGDVTKFIDDRGKAWEYVYQDKKMNQTIFPSQKKEKYIYDVQGNKAVILNAADHATYLNRDARSNIREKILPGGQRTLIASDRNHLPINITYADNTSLAWTRDYFGTSLEHKDLGDRKTKYEYNYAKKIKRQTAAGGYQREYATLKDNIDYYPGDHQHQFPLITRNLEIKSLPDQDTNYEYAFGDLAEVRDLEKKYIYANKDSEGRCLNLQVKSLKDEMLHDIHSIYDALGRDSFTSDQHKTLTSFIGKSSQETYYDLVGNVRRKKVMLQPPQGSAVCSLPQQESDHWFTYNAADNILISDGVLQNNNSVDITPKQGIVFEYDGSYRKSEKIKNDKNKIITAKLIYDNDGNLKTTFADNEYELKTTRDYHLTGGIKHYEEEYFPESTHLFRKNKITRDTAINENGWKTSEEYLTISDNLPSLPHNWKRKLRSNTLLQDLDIFGNPKKMKVTKLFEGYKVEDDFSLNYFPLESQSKNVITGIRKITRNDDGETTKTKPIIAKYLFDINGTVNTKIDAEDERLFTDPIPYAYLNTTYNGSILSKEVVNKDDRSKAVIPDESYYFLHNTNDDVLGGYAVRDIPLYSQAFHLNHHKKNNGQEMKPQITPFVVFNPNFGVAKFFPEEDIDDSNEGKDRRSNPLKDYYAQDALSFIPETIITRVGDTLETISLKLFGDKSYATEIAKINGLLTSQHELSAEQILNVPKLLPAHHKFQVSRPYNQFLNIVSGSLFPHLINPKFKDNDEEVVGLLVKMIALGIISFAAPYLAGMALQFAGISTGLIAGGGLTAISTADIFATALTGALGDAAVQGLAVEAGMQKHFSGAEVLETAVTAGVGLTLPAPDNLKIIAQNAFKTTAAAVGTQLLEMKIGMRDKFDAKAIALQVSSYVVGSQINKYIKNSKNVPSEVKPILTTSANFAANNLLGTAIHGTAPKIETMAANAVGTVVASTVNSEIAESINQNTPGNDSPQLEENDIDSSFLQLDSNEIAYQLSELNRTRLDRWNQSKSKHIVNSDLLQSAVLTNDTTYGFWHQMRVLNQATRKFIIDHLRGHVSDIASGPMSTKLYAAGHFLMDAMFLLPAGEEFYMGRLVAAWRNAKFPENPLPASLNLIQSRKWYLYKLQNIKDEPITLEHGLQTFLDRNVYKLKTRDIMKDRHAAEQLMKSEPPKTLKDLARKAYARDRVGEDFYRFLIESSKKTRPSVDRQLGRLSERLNPEDEIFRPHPDHEVYPNLREETYRRRP